MCVPVLCWNLQAVALWPLPPPPHTLQTAWLKGRGQLGWTQQQPCSTPQTAVLWEVQPQGLLTSSGKAGKARDGSWHCPAPWKAGLAPPRGCPFSALTSPHSLASLCGRPHRLARVLLSLGEELGSLSAGCPLQVRWINRSSRAESVAWVLQPPYTAWRFRDGGGSLVFILEMRKLRPLSLPRHISCQGDLGGGRSLLQGGVNSSLTNTP